jgi:hypothetical protein
MGEGRIATEDLMRRILFGGICSNGGQAYGQIIDWAKIGEIAGFSPLATVNGHSQHDYQIPQRAWEARMGWGTNGSFDTRTGYLTAEYYDCGRMNKLAAPKVEFELSEAVAGLLPIDAPATPVASAIPATAPFRTGDPGRPSSLAEFYMVELERLIRADDLDDCLAEQARSLLEWLRETHPNCPQYPSARTIENRIRSKYNKAKQRNPATK